MSGSDSRMRILVGYANYTDRLSYYDDWLDAFSSAPQFETIALNLASSDTRAKVPQALRDVDAVVLLHSTNGDTTSYLQPHVAALSERKVPLLTFVGNEVSLPGSPISEKLDIFSRLRPEFIATQLPLEAGRYLFDGVATKSVVAIPHGLNPKIYRPVVQTEDRPLDIGVRAVRYLPYLGDDDRNRLLQWFADNGPRRELKVEVSDRRLDRKDWASYLNQCKGTVATEAGGWFLERDDATMNAVRSYILSKNSGGFVLRNDSPLRSIGHKLPWWVRALARQLLKRGPVRHEAMVNEDVDFQDIYDRFFAGRARPQHYAKCISSRHFEAAGTKTCQIMFPGRFNDILTADEHYIALQPDFSNIDAVLDRFRDPAARQHVTGAAFDHVMSAHTFDHRMQQVHAVLAGAA